MVKLLAAVMVFFAANASLANSGLTKQLRASQSFQTIVSDFQAGKYQDALHQLQTHPSQDASYYYNLGTVLLKLNRIGPATAYLEKANRLEPHDIDIQENLQFARSSLAQKIGADKLDPASSWVESLAENLRINEIRGAFGLVSFIIALFWIRSYLKTRRLRETLLKPAGLLGIGALCITAGLYGVQRIAGADPAAVCLQRATIRSGPGVSYLRLGAAEAGTKLRALGPTASGPTGSSPNAPQVLWRQVRYSPDGIGWVRSSSVLLL